jgi:hypothetical protein
MPALLTATIARTPTVSALVLAFATASYAGAGAEYSLQGDFSASANPNGVWSYRHGAQLLPSVTAWQAALGGWAQPQPGWARSADGSDRLPFIFQSNGSETFTHDWSAGDVVLHTTDAANGVGGGIATIAFTVPASGRVSIAGETWLGRDIGRANDWRVVHRGEVLAAGSQASGDPYSSANPQTFIGGETTPGALEDIRVCAGDEIVLEFEKAPSQVPGDFSVVRMTVTYASIAPACAADLTGDCTVDGADLGQLLSAWGGPGDADLDGSGAVDGADLGQLLSAWGPCPEA